MITSEILPEVIKKELDLSDELIDLFEFLIKNPKDLEEFLNFYTETCNVFLSLLELRKKKIDEYYSNYTKYDFIYEFKNNKKQALSNLFQEPLKKINEYIDNLQLSDAENIYNLKIDNPYKRFLYIAKKI